MATVSSMDEELGRLGRDHITRFLERMGEHPELRSGKLLEIGPQDKLGARHFFKGCTIDTFDIVDTYKPTIVGDITTTNVSIRDDTYDCVVCMDVLEHCLEPFAAVREIRRILKHGGYLLVSAPLNFRIHGPIPDCWRFTEHGFRILLKDFGIVELDICETPGRDLFPIHYNVLAKNDKTRTVAAGDLKFRFID
jgi:SAM-dependent methyltransferase